MSRGGIHIDIYLDPDTWYEEKSYSGRLSTQLTHESDSGAAGFALAPNILEPKKSPILIFCRQFSNIEAKQNASKNLDDTVLTCGI